jgi:hypothetical protein
MHIRSCSRSLKKALAPSILAVVILIGNGVRAQASSTKTSVFGSLRLGQSVSSVRRIWPDVKLQHSDGEMDDFIEITSASDLRKVFQDDLYPQSLRMDYFRGRIFAIEVAYDPTDPNAIGFLRGHGISAPPTASSGLWCAAPGSEIRWSVGNGPIVLMNIDVIRRSHQMAELYGSDAPKPGKCPRRPQIALP